MIKTNTINNNDWSLSPDSSFPIKNLNIVVAVAVGIFNWATEAVVMPRDTADNSH